MRPSIPSDQEWSELYKSAIEFREIKCWDWMEDSELLGVQNPVDGEISYCCVMGALGQVFGLNGYLGSEGLEGYFRLQSSKDGDTDQIEAFFLQKCLAVTFGNRNLLMKEDREILKRLGLTVKGRNAWPLFRSYQPGYQPWHLTKEETLFLTVILQQAREVALNFKESWHLLNPPSKEHCLVRMPIKEGGNLQWKDRWLKFPEPRKAEFVIPPVDEVRLKRIKNSNFRKSNIWECDLFHAPTAIWGEERPYFPLAFLLVDHQTGLILKQELSEHTGYQSNFQKVFLKFIEDIKSLPKEVRVKKEEVYRLLEPLISYLGIRLVPTQLIPALEEAKEGMLEFLMPKK